MNDKKDNKETIDNMKICLKNEHNVHDVNDLSLYEVEEIFDNLEVDQMLQYNKKKEVLFPKLPSNYFQQNALIKKSLHSRTGLIFSVVQSLQQRM